jgi:hypothetical protein
VTLIVDLRHEFCVINLDGPLFICTKEEQRAVVGFYELKVYQVPKCTEGYQYSMGTVSWCHNGWSTNGWRGSRMVAKALSMRKEPDASGSDPFFMG